MVALLASSGLTITTTQEAQAQRPQPWYSTAAWRQYCPDRPPSGSATTSTPAAVERSLRDLNNRNAEDQELRDALRACADERFRDRRHNIPAYMCVGRANLMDAVPGHNARDAYCAYQSAALLGRQARNRELESQAHVGRARALEVMGSAGEVIAAYNAAIAANPNASDARVALARYYTGRSQFREARDLLVRDLTPIVRGPEAAVAIVELARASTEPNSTQRLELVRVAEAAVPATPGQPSGNVGVDSALGIAYFEPDRNLALTYLRSATERAVPESETEQLLQLEAHYYRSVIEADRGNYDVAKRHADQAGGTAEARRQQCLVRLMMGGDAVYRLTRQRDRAGRDQVIAINPSDDGQRACASSTAPDGPLLEGMFWLRYAQWQAYYFNPQLNDSNNSAWTRAVSFADAAFARGKPRYDDDNRTLLGWPGAEAIAPRSDRERIRIRDAYGFADDLADWFGRRIPCDPNFRMNLNSEETQIEPLFVHYRIVRPPSRDPYRCGPPEIN